MSRLHRTLALLALATIASHCGAQTMGLHLGSEHELKRLNGFNPGAYVRLDNGFTAGAYYNSFRRPSAYAGYTTPLYGPVDVTFVVVSGYHDHLDATAVPSVAIPLGDKLSARVSFLWSPDRGSALHLSVETSK